MTCARLTAIFGVIYLCAASGANTPCNNAGAAVLAPNTAGPHCDPIEGAQSHCNDVTQCSDPPGTYPQLNCPTYLYFNLTDATKGKKYGCDPGGSSMGVCCKEKAGGQTIRTWIRPDACDCDDCADAVTACKNDCCPTTTGQVFAADLKESQTDGCSLNPEPPPGQWECDGW
jgi:hypothetical protein